LLSDGTREAEDHIALLWSHIFSGLLVVGEKHDGIPYHGALILARKVSPPSEEWPELVKILHRVVNHTASYTELGKRRKFIKML
jgi:hypothetical protein